MAYQPNRRILVIDDNLAIHADFKKTLSDPAEESPGFVDAEAALFDDGPAKAKPAAPTDEYDIDFAPQGREGYEMAVAAHAQGKPYAVAFVDVRMPPGWDGVDTIEKLWRIDPRLQAVICTAFADYSWQDMIARLGRNDRLLILKKPFDPMEVRQLASALTEKWNSTQREQINLDAARRAELEARAYAASLETMNRALETSRQAAEATSNAKTGLLVHLAQNLFGPMDAFLHVAEQLRSVGVDNEAGLLEGIGTLCKGGGQLRRNLQDVLDLSEMEAGKLRLEPGSFSPRELARAVVSELAPAAAARQLALELECSPEVPATLLCDAQRVRQILVHLLDNALEHTPAHGFVRLALGARADEGWSDGRVSFEVIDSGSGLTRDQESLLFEPFCNTDDSRAASRGHFGLGLCVSKRLAQRMGGDLTVERPNGAGCRFVLTLKSAVGTRG